MLCIFSLHNIHIVRRIWFNIYNPIFKGQKIYPYIFGPLKIMAICTNIWLFRNPYSRGYIIHIYNTTTKFLTIISKKNIKHWTDIIYTPSITSKYSLFSYPLTGLWDLRMGHFWGDNTHVTLYQRMFAKIFRDFLFLV